ncbi:MAG: TolC family protein [Saprospiraceae bacterium]|nr:TolC family protein [Saprospiraceae bacterium]MCF8251956.1 TolC family protein [Saprospiraceae bacterium]MCF8282918.1 TolC family protein [Bacteroidales bacterium]MCF8313640.1 TolC family protein [Saprospiraceae bacterium]MCF8442347.1 TolC family protein [Saprospiraceae bacterium]
MNNLHNSLTFKILAISFLLFLAPLSASAQFDYNQIVLPEGQRPTSFEDYLVQLAWMNSPETKILEYEKTKEEKEVDLQRMDWMNDVNFGFNINEVSLSNVLQPSPDNLVLYPLYQFSTSVSLGSFTTNKKKREIEEVDVLISEMEGNQHKMKIRAETLARYRKLLLAIETLKVRTSAEEDTRNVYQISQQRFKNADLDMEDMLRASEAYNNATEKRLAAETDIQLSIIGMEEMIGIKWENARKAEERYKK